MVKVGTRDVAIRPVPRWHWGFVGVVMLSLVVSLATRTFHDTIPHSTTVQSDSPQAMRQHMDRDAVRWTSPAPKIAVEQAPTSTPVWRRPCDLFQLSLSKRNSTIGPLPPADLFLRLAKANYSN